MADPTRVVVVDVDQLRALVRDAVREAIEHGPTTPAEPSEWMLAADVAKLLGYRRSYVSELVRRHGLPCHPCGRLLRFRRAEVLAWAEKRGRAPQERKSAPSTFSLDE